MTANTKSTGSVANSQSSSRNDRRGAARAPLPMWSATVAGDGLWPECVARYAEMTSAAAPAISGEDSLVPPDWSICCGPPVSVSQAIQFRSPGATRLTVPLPDWEYPPDEMLEMLLLIHVPFVAFVYANYRAVRKFRGK